MKQFVILFFLTFLTIPDLKSENKNIIITENIAYREDVGPSTVLDLAQPQSGTQKKHPAIIIIHGGGWSIHITRPAMDKFFAEKLNL